VTLTQTSTCLEVRDLLPELALGVLGSPERERAERHLRWCAGCRKEAADLGNAAATFGFALAPAPVPDDLGQRVVELIGRTAGRPVTRRRFRTTAASLLAASVAVASLGWGAVMAGRAERFEERAAFAEQRRVAALEQFRRILSGIFPAGDIPTNETHLGQLSPTVDGQGGGAALQLVSPRLIDFSIVIVNGLDPRDTARMPYRVQLVDASGDVLRAGRIDRLDDRLERRRRELLPDERLCAAEPVADPHAVQAPHLRDLARGRDLTPGRAAVVEHFELRHLGVPDPVAHSQGSGEEPHPRDLLPPHASVDLEHGCIERRLGVGRARRQEPGDRRAELVDTVACERRAVQHRLDDRAARERRESAVDVDLTTVG